MEIYFCKQYIFANYELFVYLCEVVYLPRLMMLQLLILDNKKANSKTIFLCQKMPRNKRKTATVKT